MNSDSTSQSRREDSDICFFCKRHQSGTHYTIFWMCAFTIMTENKMLSQLFALVLPKIQEIFYI